MRFLYRTGALLFFGDGHALEGDGESNEDALKTSTLSESVTASHVSFTLKENYPKESAMTLILELSPEREAALKTNAQAHGMSAEQYALQVLDRDLKPVPNQETPDQPFQTGYGMFAKYGPAPSAEEIDENRREMFRNFAQEF